MKIAIVIPAYNEEKRIGQVISDLKILNCDLIIIDDGSSDNTYNVIKDQVDYCLRHNTNLGQGAALKTGTELAYHLDYDLIIHSDADGQFQIQDIRSLIDNLCSTDHEIIIGSRFMGKDSESMPLLKKVILNIARVFTKLFLKLNFTDPQCGLRGFRKHAYDKINWQSNDFLHCSEILGLIGKNKLNYKEIPIVVRYDEYSTQKTVRPKVSMGWKLLMSRLFD